MANLADLITNNRNWVARMLGEDPEFFANLTEQAPRFLWIGCADSRVPANVVTGLHPGEVFVHRNIANVVPHTDFNVLSVVQYAVEILAVEHIIVCGHYGCGGIQAALERKSFGLLDNWLAHIKDIAAKHQALLEAIPEGRPREDKLAELNAIENALSVCSTSVVQRAWATDKRLTVHAWIYGLHDGLIRDLRFAARGPEDLAPAYRLSLSESELAESAHYS